nr:unnamed protein product [Rangifer tarandus platyrhynchus]
MKSGWIHFFLGLIFSMPLHTRSGFVFSPALKRTLCEIGYLGDYCNYPPVSGTCKLALTRYYYDTLTFNCEPFIFSGCGSNRNNFKQKYICEKFCLPER